ncbi:MAG: SpoVA/SpoVAEb family sporulation membrane protein [Lachnospiraceae bacterium]|nr:SpoVA/SpoVAEb family sporulation membrane protein [Lachnospiraceae bacterium]
MKKQQTVNENMSPEEYEAYVKQVTPTFSLGLNMVKAFITGGIICTIGQALMELFLSYELEKKDASAATLLVIIFTTAILTGLNLFSKIVKFGGARRQKEFCRPAVEQQRREASAPARNCVFPFARLY